MEERLVFSKVQGAVAGDFLGSLLGSANCTFDTSSPGAMCSAPAGAIVGASPGVVKGASMVQTVGALLGVTKGCAVG